MTDQARNATDFLGTWTVQREIVHRDGPVAQFHGTAVWEEAAGGMLYTERGLLGIAGHPAIAASRCYRWKPNLTVWFDDGRFFHKVPQCGGPVSHWCEPDQYDGYYDFGHWPDFRVTWRVAGPRKAYRMTSLYRRTEG
ncbi:DUF6314 family protein [Sedimentitalea sp. JM2-8]|uniref:DUF6314 family protein n=1 Tax=Sedimentitalea xiamensis TaxID=3050037 RepID=A0ABT7FGR5_9RHOB|nr:DUF6314 family protein [Sedimentitalea xiamensis]MDK3074148.1 DUF6314 family protein [Sedimentitalea xiamensis]